MSNGVPEVGDQDPAARNSPIAGEDDEDTLFLRHDVPDDAAVCWFNDVPYADGSFVRSGTVILRCDRGIWIESGPADPANP
ncbi:MAG TPA: DUF1496 domain-containing protein [Woeseiaceae bacterium]|nr:DUF1496 domain-containing protein [Woeseiaceae bacterium]